jgi:hypothetical protein
MAKKLYIVRFLYDYDAEDDDQQSNIGVFSTLEIARRAVHHHALSEGRKLAEYPFENTAHPSSSEEEYVIPLENDKRSKRGHDAFYLIESRMLDRITF